MNGFWLMQAVVVASKNVNPRSAGGWVWEEGRGRKYE